MSTAMGRREAANALDRRDVVEQEILEFRKFTRRQQDFDVFRPGDEID